VGTQVKRAKKKYGWHVLNEVRVLHDGQYVKDGVWYHARREYNPRGSYVYATKWRKCTKSHPLGCTFGMHASEKLHDALRYGHCLHSSTEFWVCRVVVEGDIISYNDKFVGQKRKIIWSVKIPRPSGSIGMRRMDFIKTIHKAYEKKYGRPLRTKLTG
jgi:hypothetical protein